MKFLAICLLALFGRTFGQSITCDDSYECDDDTLSYTYVYCYGYYGCDTADITSSYFYPYGFRGAYYADVTTVYTYAYGYQALLYASVATQYLYAYGYFVAYLADIEPYSAYLYQYYYGYYAGYYADVLCYSGDYCYIYCGSSYGCLYMKFYCYSGAVCYYNCADQSVCPTLYGGVASDISFEGDVKGTHYEGLTDDEIKAKHVENKEIKKKMLESGDDGIELPGETDEAKAARIAAVQHGTIHQNSNSFGNSMVFGGAAIGTVCFIVGALVSKCFRGNEYEKI